MKISDLMLATFLGLYAIGAVVAITVPLLAEVNIAEVEGKYTPPTVQDAVHEHRVRSIQFLNLALHEAYLAGYGQAMIDFELVSSTEPAKIRTINEDEQ